MTIIKLYDSPALQATIKQIIRPVWVTYHAVDEAEPSTLQILRDVQSYTPHLQVDVQTAAADVADRLVIWGDTPQPALTFIGAPVGTEVAALLSAIVVVGRGDSGLTAATRRQLAELTRPVQVEIFTTPT